MKNFGICQLDPFQIATASEIAAKAFVDDLVFNYLTPDDRDLRFQALTWFASRAITYDPKVP
jgi:hypothetical protein